MDLDGFALHVHLHREVEPVKPPKQELLKAAYAAFNRRDLETALALLHPEVEWANGLEGETVHGPEAVRAYWTRQWGLIDPQAEPLGFEEQEADCVVVKVHQMVRDLQGAVLAERIGWSAMLTRLRVTWSDAWRLGIRSGSERREARLLSIAVHATG